MKHTYSTYVFLVGLCGTLPLGCTGRDAILGVNASGGSSAAATGETGGSSSNMTTGGAGGSTPQTPNMARSDVAYNATPALSDADYQTFVSSVNDFGFDLFRGITQNAQNVFFSPVSTAIALGMTYAGARGQTAEQMRAAMHVALPDATYHQGFGRLLADLFSRNIPTHTTKTGDKSVMLAPVNATWANPGYDWTPSYLDTLSADYNTGLMLLDFSADPPAARTTINQWVSNHTDNKIVDLLPEGALDSTTRLVLTSALYFHGSWDVPFDAAKTTGGTFQTLGGTDVTVPMMHQLPLLRYCEDSTYQMIDLDYDGAQVGMTVLLPAAGQLESIRSNLTATWLEQARAGMKAGTEVDLTLPKFGFTWGTQSLKAPLEALGMTDAFQYLVADFSGIESTRQLYMSDVFHRAFVSVDEAGTEAAASTAGSLVWRGIPKSFQANRPFLFFIRDATGALLFAGQLADPTSD